MFRLIPLITLALFLAACGTDPLAPRDGGNATDNAQAPDTSADASALDIPAADVFLDAAAVPTDNGPDARPLVDAAPDAGLRPSAAGALPCAQHADCEDGFACTQDLCEMRPDGSRRCAYYPEPAHCGAGETCDVRMGCRPGRVCNSNADCADTDPCTQGERCAMDVRLCVYASVLDGDRDGYASRACGGPDCDDSRDTFRPGVPERCNGGDDNCDGRSDEGTARELCGEGASCVSADARCVLDAAAEHADLVRACALEYACLGTLVRFGIAPGSPEGCPDVLAARLLGASVQGEVTITPQKSGMATFFSWAGNDPALVRESLQRARTATACADYLGPYYARWARCRREGAHCDGNALVSCLTNGQPSVSDCAMRGGCVRGDSGPSCRDPAPDCSLALRDYVRCDGALIRVGCGETIACRAGTVCAVAVSESMAGTSRTARFLASCVPSASAVRVRCPDGSMGEIPGRRCPPPSPACSAGTACDGGRLGLCVGGQRAEFDCAALTGGTCAGGTCAPPR